MKGCPREENAPRACMLSQVFECRVGRAWATGGRCIAGSLSGGNLHSIVTSGENWRRQVEPV